MSKANDIADWGQFPPARKNAIINGNFNVWQRGTTFPASTNGLFLADRMQGLRTGVGFLGIDKTTDHPLISGGNCFEVTVDTIDASLATTDSYGFQTKIEGYDYQRLHQNECTLSFWVKSSVAGTYYISLTNEGGPPSHSYVSDYTINATNTWEKKAITFTPGTVGTFNMTNGEGLRVRWSVGEGASNQTATLNAWQAGNFRAGTSGANFMGTLNNSFRITDVQLEVGSEATDFEQRHFADELILCQRYFQKSYEYSVAPAEGADAKWWSGYVVGVAQIRHTTTYVVEMAKDPTLTFYRPPSGAVAGRWSYWNAAIVDSTGTVLVSSSDHKALTLELAVSGRTLGQAFGVLGGWAADAEL